MMTAREAERLLGGYATGTLTEAERRALFEAALADQALFDALVDEEALRELLADPGVRAQLLEALAGPPKVAPLWRRPGWMGVAAGLLMASLAGLTWLRQPQAPPRVAPPPAQPAPAPRLEVPEPPAAPARRRAQPTAPAQAPQEASRPAGAPAPLPIPAAQEVLAEAPRLKATPPTVRDSLEKKAEAPAPARPVPAAIAGVASVRAEADGAVLPPPTWEVEALGAGSFRITVVHRSSGQLVLLRRAGRAILLVAPRSTETLPDGQRRQRFETILGSGEALDLYLLPRPVADPAALPATGPVAGFRVRLLPEGSR